MISVGSRELKTRLGQYLLQVKGGATIVVTERGRPVAELRPLARSNSDQERQLRELATRGLVTPRTSELRELTPLKIRGAAVSDTIIEEREDRL